MLSWLEHYAHVFGPLRLFGYVSSRVVLSALTAFTLMMIVMPPLIRWLKRKKFGESGAKNDGAVVVDAMRDSKKGTPTMGGLGLIGVIALTTVLWCDPANPRTWLLLFGMVAFALVGYLDDRTKIFKGAQGTSDAVKLSLQLLVALICGIGLFWIGEHYAHTLLRPEDHPAGFASDFIKQKQFASGDSFIVVLGLNQLALPLMPATAALNLGVLIIFWTLFVTTACANGVNFTDGMDGLASGVMFISALAFMVIAYAVSRVDAAEYLKVFFIPGGAEIAVFCAAIAGACLGFLWFNGAPAQVFMGDTGSQALGGALGLVALNTKQEFLIVLVGFVFVMEAASVAIQKLVFKATKHRPGGGVRVFRCAPIHHHFQYQGWPESKIVLRFWIIAALGALLALATLKLH